MKKTIGLLVFILLLGTALRFYGINSEGYDFDESFQIYISGQPTLNDLFNKIREDFNPPLFHLLLHYWMLFFGKTEFAVRTLTVIISIACLITIFFVARRLFDNRTALIATFITAIVPIQISTAQRARPYALFSLLVLLSYLFYLDYIHKRKNLTAYTVTTTLLLYTHYYSVFFIAAQTCHAFWKFRHERKTLFRLVGAQTIAGLLFLPWLPHIFRHTTLIAEGSFWIRAPDITSFFSFIEPLTAGLIGLIVILFFIAVYFATEPAPPALLLWFAIPTVLPFLASIVIAPFLTVRYIIPAGFPLYLMSARSIALRKEFFIVLLAFVAVSAQVWHTDTVSVQGEQFREIGRILSGQAENDTVIVHIPQVKVPLELYYNGTILPYPSPNLNTLTETTHFVERLTSNRAWLVISHQRSNPRQLISLLRNRYPKVKTLNFQGIVVHRFDAPQNLTIS